MKNEDLLRKNLIGERKKVGKNNIKTRICNVCIYQDGFLIDISGFNRN